MDTDKYEIVIPEVVIRKKGRFASSKRENFSDAKSEGVEKNDKNGM